MAALLMLFANSLYVLHPERLNVYSNAPSVHLKQCDQTWPFCRELSRSEVAKEFEKSGFP